ncbi:MAG: glycosyltransferase [Desulfocapsa sp.]|nr:glycosyltransferase [Desulfocapsa sp.]
MKISIITTTFNAAGTLRDCLGSVKGQTYADVEHIVVDAASTDGTLAILDENEGHLAKVLSEPDNGIYDGMNKGLRLATGDVVGILNADDFYFGPDVLGKVAGVFEEHRVDSCYGDLVYVEGQRGTGCEVRGSREKTPLPLERGKECRVVRYWKAGEFDYRKFWWGWMPPHPTFFVRRSVYERYGYFNLEMGTAADYELMLRFLVKRRITAAYLPEILIQMRSGGASNVTLAARLRANRMDRKAWEVNGLKPYPWTMLLKPIRKIPQWFFKGQG